MKTAIAPAQGVRRLRPHTPAAIRLALAAVAVLSVTCADAATFTVTDRSDNGSGSLRQAVAQANDNPGPDVIRFGVNGTIELASALEVTDDLRIDGAGQHVVLSGGDRVTLIVLSASDKSLEVARLSLVRANASRQSTGGAIMSRGNLRITEALFAHNVAPVGGAIYTTGSSLWITSSTFAGNRALSWGGALAVGPTTQAQVISSTFVGNDAAQFGGALFQNPIYPGSSSKGSLVVRNSLIAGVTVKGNCSVISNQLIDGGGNLNSDDSCPFSVANGSVNNTNPRLGELAHHGGPTMTYAPLAGSPAVDTGITALTQGAGVTTDQRGTLRVAGPRIDRGAFELQAGDTTAVTLDEPRQPAP